MSYTRNDVILRDPTLRAGGISASASIAFASTDTVLGAGAIGFTAAITVASTNTAAGTGAIVQSGAISFSTSETLKGTGAVTESATITFSDSVTLNGAGAIAESGAIAFSATPETLTGAGAITESGGVAFASSVTLKGAGAVTESGSIVFSTSETLRGAGALTGSANIALASSVTLHGSGAIAESVTLVFDFTGALVDGSSTAPTPIPYSEGGCLDGRFTWHLIETITPPQPEIRRAAIAYAPHLTMEIKCRGVSAAGSGVALAQSRRTGVALRKASAHGTYRQSMIERRGRVVTSTTIPGLATVNIDNPKSDDDLFALMAALVALEEEEFLNTKN